MENLDQSIPNEMALRKSLSQDTAQAERFLTLVEYHGGWKFDPPLAELTRDEMLHLAPQVWDMLRAETLKQEGMLA